MNSDQLLNALTDCAQASTHEPDAETINAAAQRITQMQYALMKARIALSGFYVRHEHDGNNFTVSKCVCKLCEAYRIVSEIK